ncbi:MAG TPA: VCBS domain-containing protein [Chitinophagaceae bacterium]|nr:VCBS domain-containing protein [Chitinophagaceae bacterium]
MKKIAIIALTAIVASCSPSKHASTSEAGKVQTSSNAAADGSSYEKAIVIQEQHETSGVDAEYKWIREHYPGSKTKVQSLNYNNKKPYDVLTIVTADGTEKKIYFDISNFFGKF